MSKPKNIQINTDLGVDFADEGAWRSYDLSTHGSSLSELLENAAVSEIDQDGGELDTYELSDASNEIQDAADVLIAKALIEGVRK